MIYFEPVLTYGNIPELYEKAYFKFLELLVDEFEYEGVRVDFPVTSTNISKDCDCFKHLTTVEQKDGRERVQDKHRTKRIHWIKCVLNNSSEDGIKIYFKNIKGNLRAHFLVPSKHYIVVLGKARSGTEKWYITTAHNLNEPYRMNGHLKDYRKFKANNFQPI